MIQDPILYGKSDVEGITGLHLLSDDEVSQEAYMRVYTKDGHFDDRVYPFVFVSDPTPLQSLPSTVVTIKELMGDNTFNYIAIFKSFNTMRKAIRPYKTETGYRNIYRVTTPESMYLMQTGNTFFKGLAFNDVKRLRFDIEAYSRRGFPNADRKSDKVFIITVSVSTGKEYVLYLREGKAKKLVYTDPDYEGFDTEAQLLDRLRMIIKLEDPDVIEGHNIFGFDWPYVLKRGDLYGITFDIGRDGSEPEMYESQKTFADRTISYVHVKLAGRSIIDTMFEAYQYDVIKRDLPGFGLKVVAKYFGFSDENRTYVEGDKIAQTWDEDPGTLIAYALDDVRETALISEHLGGSTFFVTQMLPFTYQKSALAGTATKIEALLVREYLRQRHSLPHPEKGRQEVGGYTDIFYTGVYEHIVYADVESLYPSIMITNNIQPDSDKVGTFQYLLRKLTKLRLDTKASLKNYTKGTSAYQSVDAKQSAYKLLINSMYGALSFEMFIFRDVSEADRVTTVGQELLNKIIKEATRDGAQVIESDTDGNLVVPPPFVQYGGGDIEILGDYSAFHPAEDGYYRYENAYARVKNGVLTKLDRKPMTDEDWVKSLTDRMPQGIIIGFDGRADVMLSYKKKNYALRENGKLKLKGGSLISRLYEPFGKAFVKRVVEALLNKDVAEIHKAYADTWLKIVSHDWTPAEFAKNATLKDDIKLYEKKTTAGSGNGGRNKSAPYELAIARAKATGIKPESGDRISYYVADIGVKTYKLKAFEAGKFTDEWDINNPDENTDFYLKRLKVFAKKFEMFFSPEDFKVIFSEATDVEFDYNSLKILNQRVPEKPLTVAIIGSRAVDDLFWIERAVAGSFIKSLEKEGKLVIGKVISGGARGADKLAEKYAEKYGFPFQEYPADWSTGKSAGIIRNVELVDLADAVIAVWDGTSPGTRHAISYAQSQGKPVHISLLV